MRRKSVLLAAGVLAIAAGVLPLIGLSWVQREQALGSQQQHLDDVAASTAKRTERTLDDAKRALLRAGRIDRADCSPEHLKEMGQVVADARSIEDLGYFRDGQLVCTRLGVISPPVPAGDADLDLGDGSTLSYAELPRLFRGEPRVEVRRGDYGVLITPGRLTDLVISTQVVYGVASRDGRVLEASGVVKPQVMQRLLAGADPGSGAGYAFSSRPVAGLVAFALTDTALTGATAGLDWRYLLPIGAAISLILIGLIIWVSRQQLSPAKTLELAIRNREFVVHYQPIINLATGLCIGAEALVRWQRPGTPMAFPDQFIPLAEATGLISPLTDLVIEVGVAEMGQYLRGHADAHLSINIPANEMESGRFLQDLNAAVAKEDLHPGQIWLEITERGFINAAAAAAVIGKARSLGYRVTIDDFGTGYSSLSLLEGLSLDALKIDKSFTRVIGGDAAQSIVADHIINMAHALQLTVIAEGIETLEQEAYLQRSNVQFGQGWLYAKALPIEQFLVFAAARVAPASDG